MEKTTAGLLGAIASLATMGAAQAATEGASPLHAASYAELLAPIPNAKAQLALSNAELLRQYAQARIDLVQEYYGGPPPGYPPPHHHHHHHHDYYPPPPPPVYHHHHHHHHHSGVTIVIPGVGGIRTN